MALHDLYNRLLAFKASRPAPGHVPPAHYEAIRQHHLQKHLQAAAMIHQAHQAALVASIAPPSDAKGGRRGR